MTLRLKKKPVNPCESTFSLDVPWTVLRDGISGTGGSLMFTDLRNLSGVSTVFYPVAVY